MSQPSIGCARANQRLALVGGGRPGQDASAGNAQLEQDYMLEGAQQLVSAPTTIGFRRRDGLWKIVLFHSIPLTPEAS